MNKTDQKRQSGKREPRKVSSDVTQCGSLEQCRDAELCAEVEDSKIEVILLVKESPSIE